MNIYSFEDQATSKRQAIIYERTYRRNLPSHTLQPYLDSRPVPTKYNIMPIVDGRKEIETPLIQQATYNPSMVFYPGNDLAPWSGYASNINHESELRNQIYALQSSSQSAYVPSSKSSLYKVNWNNHQQPSQSFPQLFKKEKFMPFDANPNANIIGYALFNNATRQQLKDLTKDK